MLIRDGNASTLLVDADLVCYRCAAGTGQKINWGDGVVSATTDLRTAIRTTLAVLGAAQKTTGCTQVVLAFSDTENFRKTVLPTYKSNRKQQVKPDCLGELISTMKERFGDRVWVRPALEADDVLGILATNKKVIRGRKVLFSGDKDLRSVPGDLFDGKVLRRISEQQADYRFFFQVLTGDSTDGYTGCPGIGPIKAAKLLEGVQEAEGSPWDAVMSAYTAAGLDEAQALQQARVARILRSTDYCYKTKQPILWSPPETTK